VAKISLILPIEIALCQKFYAKRIRNRAKSEFQISLSICIQDSCQAIDTFIEENTLLHLENFFIKGNIIYAKQRKRRIQSKRRRAAFIYGRRGLALGVFQMNESGLRFSIKPLLCASSK
jgi:hypothetical protein